MIIVSDTAPLISLLKINQIHLLKQLFGSVVIPTAVYHELVSNEKFQREAQIFKNLDFISIVPIKEPNTVSFLRSLTGLDLGESEAIVLSKQLKADTFIIDEKRGRRTALDLGLEIIGSVGILNLAYDNGLITKDEAILYVTQMRKNGSRIGDKIYYGFINSLN